MPLPLHRTFLTLALALTVPGAALLMAPPAGAQPGAPSGLAGTSRAVPAPPQSANIPAGQNTGTPGASATLPLGTPAAPSVLVAPGIDSAGRSPAMGAPPATGQPPISRPRNPDAAGARAGGTGGSAADATATGRAAADAAVTPRSGSVQRGVGRGANAGRGAAGSGFPSGLAECAGQVDRVARARCAAALYGPGR